VQGLQHMDSREKIETIIQVLGQMKEDNSDSRQGDFDSQRR